MINEIPEITIREGYEIEIYEWDDIRYDIRE